MTQLTQLPNSIIYLFIYFPDFSRRKWEMGQYNSINHLVARKILHLRGIILQLRQKFEIGDLLH